MATTARQSSSERAIRLSVLIPVLNEGASLQEVLERIKRVPLELEIVVVDDGSTDASLQIARRFAEQQPDVVVVSHSQRSGKGRALRTAFSHCRGEYVLVQDADLEYDPADYLRLLETIESSRADVVYGSRRQHWHAMRLLQRWGNWLVTWTCNRLFGSQLTDVQTCYKLFPRRLLQEIPMESSGFEIDPELTAKILRRRCTIAEVPIHYAPRTYGQGKKIRWSDGVRALWTLVKYRLASPQR